MAPPTAIGSPLAGLCPLIRPATIAFAPMLNGSVALDARPTLRNVSHSVRRAGSNSVDTIDIDLNSPDAINTLAVHVDTIGDDVDALGGDVARLAAEVRALHDGPHTLRGRVARLSAEVRTIHAAWQSIATRLA